MVCNVWSEAPVTQPPWCTTCCSCWSTASVSGSPGNANGTPGGYGHNSSALRRPLAVSVDILHSASRPDVLEQGFEVQQHSVGTAEK